MSEKISLGELLADFRETLDQDQKEVASNLSIPPSSLSFYENGKRVPPHDILVKLFQYYNARLSVESDAGKWIVKTSGEELELEKVPENEEVDLLAGLDEEEREDLISYIRRRKHRKRQRENTD